VAIRGDDSRARPLMVWLRGLDDRFREPSGARVCGRWDVADWVLAEPGDREARVDTCEDRGAVAGE
jgi:hypothetical protein